MAIDTVIAGTALESDGFTAFNTIDGLSLLTDGFLWTCGAIWSPAYDRPTTVWTSVAQSNGNIETCPD